MEHFNELTEYLAMALGFAWASGINLYAVILVLGVLGITGNIMLPENLHILMDPVVIAAAAIMYMVEFVADKTPGVDTGWDAIHTFIRIPAGAVLAASAVWEVNPALAIAAGILGGGLAAGSHAAKAGLRVMINASPEPFTNWGASLLEDVVVVGGLWTTFHYPLAFIVFVLLFILLLVWLLPRLWRGLTIMFASLRQWFASFCGHPAVKKIPPPQPLIEKRP